MKRRNFLKDTGLAGASIPMILNGLKMRVTSQSNLDGLLNMTNDRVLVLIQLQGGNDGLNTIIPLSSLDLLSVHRSNLFIPKNKIIKVDDSTGFHPSLEGMLDLYTEGKLNIIHSVGYPNQNRSHFRSTDIWSSAVAADEFDSRGWLGKYLDHQHPGYPSDYPSDLEPHPIAITMGGITSETCQGKAANFSLALHDPFSLSPLEQGLETAAPDNTFGKELEFIREQISKTNAYTKVISEAADKGNNSANYPGSNNLANQLRTVANLISGGLKTKIYVCTIGGFDTHANQVNQGDPMTGTHSYLLTCLSSAIQAFQTDLKILGLEERVLGMTFSEFGRQIASNQSLGTDHGTAAPLFLFGSCVSYGSVGTHPEIPEQLEPQEGVAMQIDFRNVYGSILMDWFEVGKSDIKELLYANFIPLTLLGNCQTTSTNAQRQNLTFEIYPNPLHRHTEVAFESKGGQTRLSVFNALGSEVLVGFDKKLSVGKHVVNLDLLRLPPGNYYFQLKSNKGQATKIAVKTTGQ